MHLTLKKDPTKPAAANFLQQQARFDEFIQVFNHERPHEALRMQCPAEVYQLSASRGSTTILRFGDAGWTNFGGGGWTRTSDLRIMRTQEGLAAF